jgi:ribosomal protein S18 acetylase RimI-like enzyme
LASKIKLPRLRVRRTNSWIEVYTERAGPYRYSYVLGLVTKEGALIISDAWLDPELRSRGLGKKMVARIIKEAGVETVEVHNVLPEAKGFWESLGIKEVDESGKFRRVSVKRNRFLEGEWFFD